MSQQSQDILSTFKSKNLRLMFCIGFPGSGMEPQVEKASNEFKYNKICTKELINKEIEQNTEIGQKLKEKRRTKRERRKERN